MPTSWYFLRTGRFMTLFMSLSWLSTTMRGAYQPPPPAELLEGELEYEVECILDHKILPSRKGRPTFEYLMYGGRVTALTLPLGNLRGT